MRPIIYLIPALLLTASLSASAPVDITIDPAKSGKQISPDFIGVSYETEALLPDSKGKHYFSPGNKALIAQFKNLGIKSLRIGGSSVDDPKVAIPTQVDIDELFKFAKEAGVKVIYSFRIKDGDPESIAKTAKYIHDNYADLLDLFAIGNEPSDIGFKYPAFHETWKKTAEAILAQIPDAKFCGPDVNPHAEWFKACADDFADKGHLVMLTIHSYPGGCSYKNPGNGKKPKDMISQDAATSRDLILSPKIYGVYDKVRMAVAPSAKAHGIPYKLGESNSFWFGGLEGVSNTYTSALWALDYLWWWAVQGCSGINFHTGDLVSGRIPAQYAVCVTSDKGVNIHPLGYGMKAFSFGSKGAIIPVTLSAPAGLNLTAYASLDASRKLTVYVINKEHGTGAQEARVTLHFAAPASISDAKMALLESPKGDTSVTTGVTLGGAPINDDGSWNGTWINLNEEDNGHVLTVTVPAASAAVIQAQVH